MLRESNDRGTYYASSFYNIFASKEQNFSVTLDDILANLPTNILLLPETCDYQLNNAVNIYITSFLIKVYDFIMPISKVWLQTGDEPILLVLQLTAINCNSNFLFEKF